MAFTVGVINGADGIRAVIDGMRASGLSAGDYYMSTPITSGLRVFEAALEAGTSVENLRKQRPEVFERIKAANEESAAFLISQLRARARRHGRLVVNPADVRREWSQDLYNSLWAAVLEEFRLAVILSPDWAYSTGARYEIRRALELGLDFYDSDFRTIEFSSMKEISAMAEYEVKSGRFAGSGAIFPELWD